MVNERAISGAIPGTLCMPCTLANAISCLVLPINPTLWVLYLDARSYAFACRRYTYLPAIINKCALRPRTNLQVSNTLVVCLLILLQVSIPTTSLLNQNMMYC